MIQKQLVAQLRAHRGPVIVGITNANDVISVQAVKSDVMASLMWSFDPDEETGFTLDHDGYLSRDHKDEAWGQDA